MLLRWPDKLPVRLEKELPEVGGADAGYLMEFVGRRTRYGGMYGPNGNMHKHAVVIDQMTALRQVPRKAQE